jgi:hypothetical protein
MPPNKQESYRDMINNCYLPISSRGEGDKNNGMINWWLVG